MIEELIRQFSAEEFSEWCWKKFDRFTADLHAVQTSSGFSKADIIGYVQSLSDAGNNRPLLVMAVHAGEQINERSSRRRQFDFARKQLIAAIDSPPAKVNGLFTQGLFVFYDDAGTFRFSLVSGHAEGRKLVFSDFKRYSFFVTPDRENKTFRSRMAAPLTTWQNLVEAFSVETLTREFYLGLFAWYERAMAPESKITFPNDLARGDDDRHMLAEHLIRLITRLMFVWFILQKKLVPNELFDESSLKLILKDFDPLSSRQDNYYRAILQNLFFATLNCEISERDFAVEGSFLENLEHFGVKLLYRYRDEFEYSTDEVIELFSGIPFLNGGLFECLDKKADYLDGFSRNPKRRAHIPNRLFLDDKGLITLFSRYDFTVDENSPNDVEIALDPELLGKVFENLLGCYNPETKATARKQSGSFYTPREIVNYMVDESLVAHLHAQVPEVEESLIRTLFSEEILPSLSTSVRSKLVEALYHCRILDPACGSGAFPIGILLKMVHVLQRLDENNTLWYKVVMEEAEKALAEAEALDDAEKSEHRKRITDSFDQSINQSDYARKLYLIENCIFGVDIQPIAVQIAKLRTFITLVCDQSPTTDSANNYGMLPLPNLETKFVAADSLIGLTSDFSDGFKSVKGVSLLDDHELVRLREELAEVRHQHFRARSSSEKNKCRKRDYELSDKIKSRLVLMASKPNTDIIYGYQKEIGKLQRQRQKVECENWQDLVASTPSQTHLFEDDSTTVQKVFRLDVNKEKRDKIDDNIRWLTQSVEVEENRFKNKGAFQKEADRLAAWDPYDQNKSSPFFDSVWMYGIKNGFDIVIGNPPYMQIRKRLLSPLSFPFSEGKDTGKQNLYKVFVEHAYNMSKKSGTVCLIVQSSLMCDISAKYTRELLLKRTRLSRFVEFPKVAPHKQGQVFEAVLQGTCIVVFDKTTPAPSHKFLLSIANDVITIDNLEYAIISQRELSNCYSSGFYIPLVKTGEFDIARSIFTRSKPLSEYIEILRQGDVNLTAAKAHITQHLTSTKLVRGRNVAKYRIDYDTGDYIAHGWHETTARANVSQTSLVCQEVTGTVDTRRLHFARSEQEMCLFGHSTNKLVLRSGISDTFVLGILNSRLMDWIFRQTSTNNHVSGYEIKALPVCGIGTVDAEEIAKLVWTVICEKKKDFSADVTVLEAEIDSLVFQLYNLTPSEISIVEDRYSRAKKIPKHNKTTKMSPTQKRPRKSVMTEDLDLT